MRGRNFRGKCFEEIAKHAQGSVKFHPLRFDLFHSEEQLHTAQFILEKQLQIQMWICTPQKFYQKYFKNYSFLCR